MKAKGLEALASAAAGSPQATPVHQEVVKEAESATATGEATATSTSNLSSGINLNNLTPQQQQQIMQLMKSQSSNSTNPMNNAHNNNAASALLGGLQSMSQTNTNPLLALQQQLASQQLLQLLFNRQPATTGNPTQQTTTMSNNRASSFLDSQNAQKLQALLSGIQAHSKLDDSQSARPHTQLLPKTTMAAPQLSQSSLGLYNASMKNSSQGSLSSTGAGDPSTEARKPQAIAPAPPGSIMTAIAPTGSAMLSDDSYGAAAAGYDYFALGDKKQQKRAANRKSAQLSRKRKKQLMEELKDENDDLRRKEQILKSIPDLIIVFDSTGKLWFVSESVSNFLKFSASELEGTSIWDRLCKDSVRLLKAAFMDSLAARENESSTAPLGQGFWELRLTDRDGGHKVVTLNGVVHFAGERPECVCSIRPVDRTRTATDNGEAGGGSDMEAHSGSLIRVKPSQSVVSNSSHSDHKSMDRYASHHGAEKQKEAFRISDSGNSGSSSSNSVGESEATVSGDD